MLAKRAHTQEIHLPLSVPESGVDRRSRPRVALALPIFLFRSGDPEYIEATTDNITADSFYCVSERPIFLNERLECEVVVPGDQLSSVPEDDLRLSCRVRVVRVVAERRQAGFGAACVLEDYTITRSASEPKRH